MSRLKGRTAIVTGASSGIGAAIAVGLAAEGASIVLAARRADKMAEVAAKAKAAGAADVLAVTADITDEAAVLKLFKAADEKFGQIDILVNGAGVADHTPTDELSFETWNWVVGANLHAAFLCSREAFKRMKAQKRGRILNIGSLSAKTPRPNTVAYAATKFALEGLTQSMAIDGRDHGVGVCILHPGSTFTGLIPDMASLERSMMAAEDVARIATLMLTLPDDALLYEALALPLSQPFLGRG
jgi:NAD(P)-dependent dehydrogenase (short-subunit alcohol dehydrogenase family)